MTDYRNVLERDLARVGPAPFGFDDVARRRDRKRRNQRIAAGALGLAVGLAAILIGSSLIRSEQSVPVQPAPTSELRPVLREGEVIVEGNGQGQVDALDPQTGDQRTLATCKDPCAYITRHAISADGRWLAYEIWTCLGALPCESEAGIWATNALGEDRQLTQQCDRPDSCHQEVWAWSPAGATLAVGESGNAPGLFTIDPQSGERTDIANDDNVTALAWSPDGTRVAYAASAPPIGTSHKEVAAAYAESAIHVVELATGRSTTLSDALGYVETMAWSPDGTRLVVDSFVGDRERITVLETDGSDQRVLVDQGAPQGPGAPAWSPDGTRIAYVSTPGSVGPNSGHFSFEVWVIGADGSAPTRLFHGKCCIGDWDGPVWSPDGGRIAFFDDIDVDYGKWLVVNAGGTGGPTEIDELEVKSWRSDA
jgi:Tol biopolymer transport system component